MKILSAAVSSKGQVVLPRAVRERLGVGQGDQVEFVLDDQGVHVRPRKAVDNPFAAWVGQMPIQEDRGEALTRHAGLDEEDLRLLRAGPGAKVTRLKP